MIIYMKLGKIRGLSLELNWDLGAKPIFQKNSFHYETIIDIPYAQIIYTSGKWKPRQRVPSHDSLIKKIPIRSASNVNEETGKTTKSPRRVHKC